MSEKSEIGSNNLIRESANLVGMGLLLQEKEDYINCKPLIQQGIDKIKQALVRDNIENKGILIEFVKSILYSMVYLISFFKK